MKKINKFAKIGGLVLPLLLLMTALSTPVALADSNCSHCHQEEKDCRSRPKLPRRFRASLSFFEKHLHLRNGELFVSASRTAALKKGISDEVFSKFQQVVEEMNEMKEEGLLTFEKEKGIVMVNSTEKLEEKVDSMLASEGPSLAATSSCRGVNKYRTTYHWWGWQNRQWLDSCRARRLAYTLETQATAEGIIGLLAIPASAGIAGALAGTIALYSGYVASQIRQHNNGTGVVINTAYPYFAPVPLPDVWSQ